MIEGANAAIVETSDSLADWAFGTLGDPRSIEHSPSVKTLDHAAVD